MLEYSIIVIGGGHAGVEAACVAARMGVRVALVTMDASKIGAMSCNPAIGGLGKGHLVREVDAFDGVLGKAADAGAIHYRMLNRSKGSAVWGPRVQADRVLFGRAVRAAVAAEPSLDVIEGEVSGLRIAGDRVRGVTLSSGDTIACEAAVLCTGTFLGGVLFRGEERFEGGRVGEGSAAVLASQLRETALPMARLKTGTPPRLDGRTIHWSQLERQESDKDQWTMSPLSGGRRNPQIFCESRGPMRVATISFAPTSHVRRFTPGRSMRGGRDIVPLSRTRSIALAIGRGTRYSWSRKGSIRPWSIRTGSALRYPPTYRRISCERSRGSKRFVSLNPAMPSSMTTSIHVRSIAGCRCVTSPVCIVLVR